MPRMRAYLARAGYGARLSDVSPEVSDVARAVYAEAMRRAEPAAFVRDMPRDEWLELERSERVQMPEALRGVAGYSLIACSIGEFFDDWVDEFFATGEPLRALLADSWGSEAVERVALTVDERMRATHGAGTIRFAPGYGGFDVRNNFAWLGVIAAGLGAADGRINMSVDPGTGIICPRKSIICAIGWA